MPIRRPGAGIPIDRDKLVRLRLDRLLSRAALADAMRDDDEGFKITPDAIAKIENGHRRPKPRTLAKLCEALGCEATDLFMAEGGPCRKCEAKFGHEPGCPDAT